MNSRFFRTHQYIAAMLRRNIFQSKNLSHNPARFKSTVKIDLHITGVFTEPHAAGIIQDLKISRARAYSMLDINLKEGIRHFKNHDLREAMSYFENVIAFKTNDDIDNLSIKERKLIALALTHAADIERIGTEANEDKALEYLNQALELSPGLNEAQELKNALLSDRVGPRV